jgi:1-phosphofructokinase family hexose kinase
LLVAGPNLTVDRTSSINELHPGAVLRVEAVVVTPGGKGVNVCRAAKAIGIPARLAGFVPGRTGEVAAVMLADEGIELLAVPCGGELRSTSIVIEHSGRTTVLNEPGPPLMDADWRSYVGAVRDALSRACALVCSGSVPPRTPATAYAELAALALAAGRPCVVDTSGAVLREAVASGIAVVAPNLAEAEAVLGNSPGGEDVEAAPDARERAAAAARGLIAAGAPAAVVTAAAAGAAFAAVDGPSGWFDAPEVSVRNPIGAGDAFTAALAARLADGATLGTAVRHAVAAGSASVESPLAGSLDPIRAVELSAMVAAASTARVPRGQD